VYASHRESGENWPSDFVSVDDAVRLQGLDITPGYIKEAQKRFKNITIDDLIRLKGMGIL
jgi:hypothetical protein